VILFSADSGYVREALDAGIDSVIVDWEWRGKEARQLGADTEINRQTAADLEVLLAEGVPRRYCRINRLGAWSEGEVEAALEAGATHLFLPMVERAAEVEEMLGLVRGRAQAGILLETASAAAHARDFSGLPLFGIYVGLNDLAISLGNASIFTAVADGTLDRARRAIPNVPFGFGGVTVADGGVPVPFPLLLGEIARLGCSFSFARRSFKRDMAGRIMREELARIQDLWRRLRARDERAVATDREAFCRVVGALRTRLET
jgi:hypothetical protein